MNGPDGCTKWFSYFLKPDIFIALLTCCKGQFPFSSSGNTLGKSVCVCLCIWAHAYICAYAYVCACLCISVCVGGM